MNCQDASWEQTSNRSRQATPETGDESGQKKKRSRSLSSDDALKKRLLLLFKFVNEYQVNEDTVFYPEQEFEVLIQLMATF